MRALLRTTLGVALAASLTGACGDDAVSPYAWEPGVCPIDIVADQLAGVECGMVTVPLDYTRPGDGTLQIAVARVLALDGEGASAPIMWLEGGPGNGAIETRLNFAIATLRPMFGFQRDIILIDPRGTGASIPSLDCASVDPLQSGEFEVAETIAAGNLRTTTALRRCRGDLNVAGVDPWHFNGVWNALDVDAVREVLGYETMALYANSWGTRTAQRVLAAFGDRVESAVLDGVVPAAQNPINTSPATSEAALARVFAACEAQFLCNDAFPGLAEALVSVMAATTTNPIALSVTTSDGVTREWRLTAGRLAGILSDLLNTPNGASLIPRLITETARGETGLLRILLTREGDSNTRFDAAYWSVLCAEYEPDNFVPPIDSVTTEFGAALAELANVTGPVCELWSNQLVDPRVHGVLVSRVPVLLISGEFDPAAPDLSAPLVSAGLMTVHEAVLPGVAQGTFDTVCGRQIAAGFFASPTAAPSTRCARDLRPRFDPGREGFVAPDGSYRVPLPIGWTTRSLETIEMRFSTENRAALAVGYVEAGSVDEGIAAVRRQIFDDFVGRRVTTSTRQVAGREWTQEFFGDNDSDVLYVAGTWQLDLVWLVAIRGPRADVQSEFEVFREAIERFGIVGPAT